MSVSGCVRAKGQQLTHCCSEAQGDTRNFRNAFRTTSGTNPTSASDTNTRHVSTSRGDSILPSSVPALMNKNEIGSIASHVTQTYVRKRIGVRPIEMFRTKYGTIGMMRNVKR